MTFLGQLTKSAAPLSPRDVAWNRDYLQKYLQLRNLSGQVSPIGYVSDPQTTALASLEKLRQLSSDPQRRINPEAMGYANYEALAKAYPQLTPEDAALFQGGEQPLTLRPEEFSTVDANAEARQNLTDTNHNKGLLLRAGTDPTAKAELVKKFGDSWDPKIFGYKSVEDLRKAVPGMTNEMLSRFPATPAASPVPAAAPAQPATPPLSPTYMRPAAPTPPAAVGVPPLLKAPVSPFQQAAAIPPHQPSVAPSQSPAPPVTSAAFQQAAAIPPRQPSVSTTQPTYLKPVAAPPAPASQQSAYYPPSSPTYMRPPAASAPPAVSPTPQPAVPAAPQPATPPAPAPAVSPTPQPATPPAAPAPQPAAPPTHSQQLRDQGINPATGMPLNFNPVQPPTAEQTQARMQQQTAAANAREQQAMQRAQNPQPYYGGLPPVAQGGVPKQTMRPAAVRADGGLASQPLTPNEQMNLNRPGYMDENRRLAQKQQAFAANENRINTQGTEGGGLRYRNPGTYVPLDQINRNNAAKLNQGVTPPVVNKQQHYGFSKHASWNVAYRAL